MCRTPLAAHPGDVDRARASGQAIVHLRAANRNGVPYSALYENTAPVDFATMWDYEPLRQLLAEHECGEE